MRRIGAAIGVVIVLVLVGGAWFVLGRSGVQAGSQADPDVTITCDAWTSVSEEACRSWGDVILGEGALSHTFDMDDLAQLTISRPTFGFASTCRVQYFLERYADDPAWTDETVCAGG